jgi:hypothetical protein
VVIGVSYPATLNTKHLASMTMTSGIDDNVPGWPPKSSCLAWSIAGTGRTMTNESNLNDDEIQSVRPTDDMENLDVGGDGPRDSGDEPTEGDDDLDAGGEGAADTGDSH